jgi:hypothetical protein
VDDRGSLDSFSTVLSFVWALPRDEVMRVLRHQINWARTYSEQLWSSAEDFDGSETPADGRPWVVPEQFRRPHNWCKRTPSGQSSY